MHIRENSHFIAVRADPRFSNWGRGNRVCARSAKFPTAGVRQGTFNKGPGSSRIVDALLCYVSLI